MPTAVRIELDDDEHRRLKEAKGDRTWREVLKAGVEDAR